MLINPKNKNKMMRGKKGAELTMNTVVIAVLVLVALAIILLVFTGVFGKGAGELNCQTFYLTHDTDSPPDGVNDAIDPCPCDPRVPKDCTGPIKDQPPGCPGTKTSCPSASSCPQKQLDACKASKGK